MSATARLLVDALLAEDHATYRTATPQAAQWLVDLAQKNGLDAIRHGPNVTVSGDTQKVRSLKFNREFSDQASRYGIEEI